MNGFEVWRIATATKMHFESEGYDAFRFHFKAKNLTTTAFENRQDRYFFEKLANLYPKADDIKKYAFANIFFNDVSWVGSMTHEPYINYCKRVQSFSYLFKKDLNALPQKSLDELLSPVNGTMPPLIMLCIGSRIIMDETIIAIHCVTNFLNLVSPKIKDKLLWPEIHRKYLKATPFLAMDINQAKVKKMLLDHFSGVQSTDCRV
jgi:hypothetical protein